ncbi:MAG: hypothetical protein AAFP90_12675, partial [Planctomycetota bacterium]
MTSQEDELTFGGRPLRMEAMIAVPEETFARIRKREDWTTAEYEADKIRVVIDEIKTAAREALQTPNHSRHYWFILIRRHSNLLWEELKEATKSELNEWQNPVVNLATKLTLLATTDDEPHEWVESDGIRGITYADLGHPELIAIAKVFSLAAWWYDAESKFRFASKNFRVFANAGESNALDSQDTTAITDYEARRSKFGTLSGSAGLWYDPHRVYANDSDLCIWYGVVQALPGSFAISSVEPAVELPVQYLMSPAIDYLERRSVDDPVIPFDHLILHEMLRPAFEEAFGCEASKTVAFLYVIRRFLYSNLRMPRLDYDDLTFKWEDEPMSFRNQILHHWSDVTSLGLLRSDKASWLAGLGREAEVVHDYDSSIPLLDEAEITGFVERFTWLDGEAVYDDQPRLFTKLSSKALVLDLVWLGDFLRHVLLQAGIASRESKNMKEATGPWLEKQAKSFFIRELSLDP